jgi:hypothetical protein
MSDWMYEATFAQAKLESANAELDQTKQLLNQYETALKKIATAYLELSQDKAYIQRDEFVSIARRALK